MNGQLISDGFHSSADSERSQETQDENRNLLQGKETSKWDLLRGHLFGLLMALSYTISACCAQCLGEYVPPFELNVWRFGSQLLFVAPIVLYQKLPLLPSKTEAPYFAVYCFIAAIDNILLYESSIYIPVGTLGGLESTCLIVLLTLTTFVLHRVFNVSIFLSVVFSVTGIIFLIQPAFIFGSVPDIYTTPCVFIPEISIPCSLIQQKLL